MDWDEYYIKMAEFVSRKSKDRSTKVGAVIVGLDNEVRSTGYNNFPRYVNDDVEERHQRPLKYEWTEHAERNAIYNAARHGASLRDCIIYLNWGSHPCADCARAIIQAGIIEVVMPFIPFGGASKDWEQKCGVGGEMLVEAGIIITYDRRFTDKKDLI